MPSIPPQLLVLRQLKKPPKPAFFATVRVVQWRMADAHATWV